MPHPPAHPHSRHSGRAPAHQYWPVFDLRITTPDLVLRPMTEADLPALSAIVPHDLELDPSATRYQGLADPVWRGVVMHQEYWRRLGNWSPGSRALRFVAFRGDEMLGVQELEGTDFARLRTVDSFSFLAGAARGRGYGKQMRRAALALAFGPMAAELAVTSAWHDNHASLGVSRSIGYEPNGELLHRRGDGMDRMVYLRLTRKTWLARGLGDGMQVSGFEPCRPFFGLAAG